MDIVDSTESIGITLSEAPPHPPIQFGMWMIAIPIGLTALYYILRGSK